MTKKKYLTGVVNPVLETGNHWETQEFKKGTHNGEDLINRTNITKASPCYIIAIECGRVTYTGYTSTRGYYVELQHDNGKFSRYLHLKENSIKVKKNDLVKKGDILGYMGESGVSEGIHLHLAIFSKINGVEKYEDPYDYLVGKKNFNNTWDLGIYRTIKSKYIRETPKVATNNYVLVKECNATTKPKLTSSKPNDKARFKIGVQVNITAFTSDSKGNLWGKMKNTWICVRDSSGNQVVKI